MGIIVCLLKGGCVGVEFVQQAARIARHSSRRLLSGSHHCADVCSLVSLDNCPFDPLCDIIVLRASAVLNQLGPLAMLANTTAFR